jgi:DEAD/DEAH box helicase domain-containing protein
MRVITYDLEIAQGPEEIPGGWEAIRKGEGGVSCVSLYDTATERYHLYDENDLEECADHLNQADILVSFNGIEFDTPCFQGASGRDVYPNQYDILHEIWKALGEREKGYKLNQICHRLSLGEKNNDGAGAVELYRNGRFGKLFDYCMSDVSLTRKLANFINRYGYVLAPDGSSLYLATPGTEV